VGLSVGGANRQTEHGDLRIKGDKLSNLLPKMPAVVLTCPERSPIRLAFPSLTQRTDQRYIAAYTQREPLNIITICSRHTVSAPA
jgi:hypothetical protein